jgi:hypothetical protein
MANVINEMKDAPGVIAKMAAQMLADKVQFCKTIEKADVSDYNGKNGYQSGDTIVISKPARFIPSTSADVTSAIQDVVEEKTTLPLDTRRVVPIQLTSAEVFTDLGLASWTKRVLDPAVSSIAQHVESAFLDKAVDAVYNSVGTAGSETFDLTTTLAAGQKITENACPDLDNRFLLLSPKANRLAVVARKGLFQSATDIAEQYRKGYIGTADGFDFLSNNLLPTHINGNDVVFEVRTTVSTQGQSTLVVEALTTTTGTVTKGTVFTIAGVFAVHPITKATLEHLQQFTVTADATADGSGYATLSVSPAFYTSGGGGLQNISAFPADGAAITPVGAASTGYVQNLAYHKSAFRMVSVPLMLPNDAHMAAQETVDGMTIRAWMASDILTDTMTMRLDFLGGLAAVRPEWACRITN